MPKLRKSNMRDTPKKANNGIVCNIYAHWDCRTIIASSGMVAGLGVSCAIGILTVGALDYFEVRSRIFRATSVLRVGAH